MRAHNNQTLRSVHIASHQPQHIYFPSLVRMLSTNSIYILNDMPYRNGKLIKYKTRLGVQYFKFKDSTLYTYDDEIYFLYGLIMRRSPYNKQH